MKKKLEMKKSVLAKIKELLKGEMGEEHEESLQKVTVAAPDAEGLKEGLSKAQEILEERRKMRKSE